MTWVIGFRACTELMHQPTLAPIITTVYYKGCLFICIFLEIHRSISFLLYFIRTEFRFLLNVSLLNGACIKESRVWKTKRVVSAFSQSESSDVLNFVFFVVRAAFEKKGREAYHSVLREKEANIFCRSAIDNIKVISWIYTHFIIKYFFCKQRVQRPSNYEINGMIKNLKLTMVIATAIL